MSIGDKPVRPHDWTYEGNQANIREMVSGLTYREWLIGMLASNPNFAQWQDDDSTIREINARDIIQQVDVIINQLDKEVKE